MVHNSDWYLSVELSWTLQQQFLGKLSGELIQLLIIIYI